jgi:hypothetical protein
MADTQTVAKLLREYALHGGNPYRSKACSSGRR